jgi:hypothetical protein
VHSAHNSSSCDVRGLVVLSRFTRYSKSNVQSCRFASGHSARVGGIKQRNVVTLER